MTRITQARNVGTVCLGTVLIGLGCSPAEQSADDDELEFSEQPKVPRSPLADGSSDPLPQPSFGPVGRKAASELTAADTPPFVVPVSAPETHTQTPLQGSVPPSPSKLREELLTTVSEAPLAEAAPAPIRAPGTSEGTEALTKAIITAEPAPDDIAAAVSGDPSLEKEPGLSATVLTEAGSKELAPAPASEPEQIASDWSQFTPGTSSNRSTPKEAGPDVVFAPGTAEEGSSPPPAGAVAGVDEEPERSAFTLDESSAATFKTASATTGAAPPADASPAADREPSDTRSRSIPAHSDGEQRSEQPAPEATTQARQATLAALVPEPRRPVPMVTTVPPEASADDLKPANDTGFDTLSAPPTFAADTPASFAPPPRTQTTLGLGQAAPEGAAPEPRQPQLSPDRGATFTTSAEPPQLSYQDELILEIRVKGVNASDTILAYGTRGGVYLPIGTLARILDLAVTVSDDGNYANGWVLAQDRTLTIDLRQRLLTISGKETKLPANAAVAFDGELYLLSDRMADFLPIKVETDLRGQIVTLETLEPFPFEERMKREEERQRLAARPNRVREERFPRQETPWRAASTPMADVEIRAVSDNSFGPRAEVDLQLASDLGYLTAEAFLSGDTRNGLISSLITAGRQDPDADLLGPLSATEFAFGDVSTVSLPIGLRSVAGRGFAVTNTPPEAVSVFEKIDLRGILPDGYEVELYRNDILVGSTREAVNGQYEFLQIPVDFGLNVFRLVFFGPQGQRSEQVRRISVGDGRLPAGKLVYRIGAAQKDENVLGVRSPNFVPPRDFGTWRTTAELSYGVSSDITAVLGGAWFQTALEDRWVTSAGIRTGISGFAVKADFAASNNSSFAITGGVAGKIGGSAINLSHVEYSGEFVDETRSISGEFLRRATELDFNTSLSLGNPVSGLQIPITARARHVESINGRKQTDAAIRASTRFPGLLASNTLEFSRTSLPQLQTQSRLFGNFDLATLGRSRTRGRFSLGYQIMPEPDLTNAAIEVDHAIDENTAIRGSLGYAFQSKSAQVGLSAVRDFDRFTLALDGNYGFHDKAYSIGLRLGFSFGRDPLRGNFFIARPGLANSGGASVRAFRDMDGDGVYGPTDSPLPEVNFIAFNQTAETGADGIARLSGLGSGRGVSIQVDSATLPDIDLAPAVDGIEIVPRPGRIHSAEFPIVALSEVEGTVSFKQGDNAKGVSGVRLKLQDTSGKDVSFAKTEIDGYFFFERIKPGAYTLKLDADQAKRLNLCAAQDYTVSVGFEPDTIKTDVAISQCSSSNELEVSQ